jgi:uncharacterized protein (DUF1800 family)
MARDSRIEHLLRRAGFGAIQSELDHFIDIGFDATVDWLLDYPATPDKLTLYIQQPGFVGVTTRGTFSPNTVLVDARQRWLFRMVHSLRPLQEKMTLFWHNHFATAYSKIAGVYGAAEATRLMAAKADEDQNRQRGQIELFREMALGNFRDLVVEVARDPAMLVWLDGRTNVKAYPQENFARELMELFTMGVGHYVEQDVYAGARVFTGWNLGRVAQAGNPATRFDFRYNGAQHDTTAKTFTFPIYPGGGRSIPARPESGGMQDGIDLIEACCAHPATGPRLARKLYAFFVSEVNPPSEPLIALLAETYYSSGYSIKAMVREILRSHEFSDPANYYSRYMWPVEFVVKSIREVGWVGYTVNDTLGPLAAMGQQLFEPPDVNGWDLGPAWISSGGMLARMNYAASLTLNQRVNLRDAARPHSGSPEALLGFMLGRLTPADFDGRVYDELLTYLRAGGAWTGSDSQLLAKAPGLAHLILGAAEYQFN